jgi:diaminopimelate decarboxylase
MMLVQSPNVSVQPSTTTINEDEHLVIGGIDTVELAEKFGTPLWIMDEQTILDSIKAFKEGLAGYPNHQILYAGKAFLCTAICHLIKKQGLGLDVVSPGELATARAAGFPAEIIFMHGNNKSAAEIEEGLALGNVNIVIDNESELLMVAEIAQRLGKMVRVFLRVIPGVEPDTHVHIVTGHAESKFGFALEALIPLVQRIQSFDGALQLVGLHAHIGSQSHDLEPYFEISEILADCYKELLDSFQIELPELDIGGGLGIAYTDADKPTSIYEWAKKTSEQVAKSFKQRGLALPKLLVEPGRTIVGTAGVTLYRAGHKKRLPSGVTYLAVDGGMADNPRPITYDAKYTACIANRMRAPIPDKPLGLVGKFCESGDIIIKESYLSAETGDLIAVFGTGAYNLSMASNYNRTPRPACVLVAGGKADIIVERETNEDLLKLDRVPDRLR